MRAFRVGLQNQKRRAGRSGGRVALAAVALSGVLMLGGCATGEYTYATTIGTGERLVFPLVNGSPAKAKKGSIEVLNASLIPNPNPAEHKHIFLFVFAEADGVPPKSVVVEDVTDRELIVMVDDQAPKLAENNHWRGTSKLLTGEDREVEWLGQLGDTMRVYRFTVTKSDGKQVVLHQGWMIPGRLKAPLRKAFGLPQL